MPRPPSRFAVAACLALALALAAAGAAQAGQVALAGVLGSKALIVVGSGAPRAMAPGETYQGVKLVSASGSDAVVQVEGRTLNLRLGAPVSVGGSGANRRAVLTPDAQGHFVQDGQINGRRVTFIVDTGASTVALGQEEAERLGLAFRTGDPVNMRTANGTAQGWRIKLDKVRLGDIELLGVQAVVTPQPMPFVLLGNSFLAEVQMTRNAQQMVLEKR